MGEDPPREESSNDDRSANGNGPQPDGDDPSGTEAAPTTDSGRSEPTTDAVDRNEDDDGDGADGKGADAESAEGDGGTATDEVTRGDDADGDGSDGDDVDSDDADGDDPDGDDPDGDDPGGDDMGGNDDDGDDDEDAIDSDVTGDDEDDKGGEDVDDDASDDDADEGDDGDVTGVEGPETDQEMPLADHIEEMMRRLGLVFLVGGIALVIAFPSASELINYFWSYHIPEPNVNRPRLYGPLELVLTRIKVAGLAGVVVGLPVFVYQTYRFMRPGLYRRERRYYLAAIPTSLILGGLGVLFAHFLVLPAIFNYFTTYTSDAATIAFGLKETFNLIVVMLSFMAIVFQIPLFIMLAIMMNLVTRQWLEDKRLIFWGTFLGIAFLFSPDPTGMAPIIVTLTMIVLYEGTLALLRWTGN